MNEHQESVSPPSQGENHKKKSLNLYLFLLVLGLSLIVMAYYYSNQSFEVPSEFENLLDYNITENHNNKEEILTFYNNEISPLVDQNLRSNQEAADRAILLFQEKFKESYQGIDKFTEDMTGWGTRFNIARRKVGDVWNKWWNEDQNANEVSKLTVEKFQESILSPESLTSMLEDVIQNYQQDLIANRNLLLSEVQIVIKSSESPIVVEITDESIMNFKEEIQKHIVELTSGMGERSVVTMILSTVGGTVVEESVRRIIYIVTPYVMSKLAAVGVVSTGVVATTTTSGGVLGSMAGPAGTIVGVGAGIAVGVAVDWWMTENFKGQMSESLNTYLSNLESIIIEGAEGDQEIQTEQQLEEWHGLRAVLNEASKRADETIRKAILNKLNENVEA